nr:fibropellin-1-like isoform X9 [Parasteatoda tepidariorum]
MLFKSLICVIVISFSYGFKDDVARRLYVDELKYENTQTKIDSYPSEKTPENAHCMCENGQCLRDSSGELKCVCLQEYGLYDSNRCKACLCGPRASCTFKKGFFKTYVNCICPEGTKKGADKRCEGEGTGAGGYSQGIETGKYNAGSGEDLCRNISCRNGGRCIVSTNGAQCLCRFPYEGKFCEIDPCANISCRNGGKCVVSGNGAQCFCRFPYEGRFCEIDTDLCRNISCRNGGRCINSINGAQCLCRFPYEGKLCEIDPCANISCRNGGKCVVGGNGAQCFCRFPYEGKFCEIDPCANISCRNGGKCVVSGNGAHCLCRFPYEGRFCEIDTDLCRNISCRNGGKCINIKNGVQCLCRHPYEGKFCEIDPCANISCRNGGKCVAGGNGAQCLCNFPYEGRFCEIDTDLCRNISCRNGGKCINSKNGAQCLCRHPYEGKFCEIEVIPEYSSTDAITLSTEKIVTEDLNTTFSETFNITSDYDYTRGPLNYTSTVIPTSDNFLNFTNDFSESTAENSDMTDVSNLTEELQ